MSLRNGLLRLGNHLLELGALGLGAANSAAFESGYQAAYANYRALSDRYVAELRKPRIRLGPAIGIVGAASIGLVVGRVLP